MRLVPKTVGSSNLFIEKKKSTGHLHLVCRGLNGITHFTGSILPKSRVRDMCEEDLKNVEEDGGAQSVECGA